MKKRLLGLMLILCILLPMFVFAVPVSAATTTSITQFGITWTFEGEVEYGQFANGDYWVVGPVTITSITPKSSTAEGITMHGSMLNPPLSTTQQGFDSRIGNGNNYVESKNVAREMPLVVQPGSSLLSCESHLDTKANPQNFPQMKTIAILTVLAEPAAEGDFRPPYVGTDKSLNWNKKDLDYTKLGSVANPGGAVPLATLESRFERPWIEINLTWAGRNMHPDLNQLSLDGGIGTYGREIANTIGAALLALQLDYTDAQKEKLLISIVQYGIDIYGAARIGGNWGNDGGHNMGRKMVLLLAGAVLGDENIMEYGDAAKHRIFQEDQQTFYIAQAQIDGKRQDSDNRARAAYTSDMLGLAEWGEKHVGSPERDGSNWNAYYRDIAGSTVVAAAVTAHIMELEEEWNWPPFFDYIDRLAENQIPMNGAWGSNDIPGYASAMWKAYRSMGSDLYRGMSLSPDYIVYDKSEYSYTSAGVNEQYLPWFNVMYTGDDASREVVMFVAEYDADDTMVSLTSAKVTCVKDKFSYVHIGAKTSFTMNAGSTYKAFLWDAASLTPLMKTRPF